MSTRSFSAIFCFCVLGFLASKDASASSVFQINSGSGQLVARNYDWYAPLGHGYIFVNKRNVLKTALNIQETGTPARWLSRFVSLTVNQLGKEFPVGGMNERGLVVEMIPLLCGQNSNVPAGEIVNENQFVQYFLDQFESTTDVIAHARKMKLRNDITPSHYFVCDVWGACAIIEFMYGSMQVYGGNNASVNVLTNTMYQEGYSFYLRNKNIIVPGQTSLARYLRLAQMITNNYWSFDNALAFLERVQQADSETQTHWSVVYDSLHLKLFFRNGRTGGYRSLSLGFFDPSCKGGTQVLDLSTAGDPTASVLPYSAHLNSSIAEKNLDLNQFKPTVTEAYLQKIADYPETQTSCLEK